MCCFDVHVCGGLDVRCVRFFLARYSRAGFDAHAPFWARCKVRVSCGECSSSECLVHGWV